MPESPNIPQTNYNPADKFVEPQIAQTPRIDYKPYVSPIQPGAAQPFNLDEAIGQTFVGLKESAAQTSPWLNSLDYTTPFKTELAPTLRYDDPKLGFNPFNPNQEQVYGDAQHWYEKLWNNSIKSIAGFGGGLLQTLGTIPSALYAATQGDLSKAFNNDFTESINDWIEGLETSLPNYQTSYERDHPFLSWVPFVGESINTWGNLFKNLSFMGGAIVGSLAQDVVIGSMTGGLALPEMIGPQIFQIMNRASKIFSSGAKTAQEALTTIAQGEKVVSVVNRNYQALKNIDRFRQATALATNGMSQGIFFAQQARKITQEQLHDEFYKRYGRDPYGDEAKNLSHLADSAGNATFLMATALTLATDSQVLGSIFKSAKAASKEVQSELLANTKMAVNKKNIDLVETVEDASKFKILRSAPARMAKASVLEGLKFGGFHGISTGAEDFYLRKFKEENIDYTDNLVQSMGHGFKEAFGTRAGLESVFMGMLMGPVIHGGKRLFEKYQGIDNNKESVVKASLGLLNDTKLSSVFEHGYGEAVTASSISRDMKDAAVSGDIFRFKNLKFQQLFNFIATGIRAGKFDMRLEQLHALKDMDRAQLEKFLKVDLSGVDKSTVNYLVDSMVEHAQQIKSNVEKVDRVFKNPYRGKDNKGKHAEDYLDYVAYEEYKHQLAYDLSARQDLARRAESLRGEMRKISEGLVDPDKVMDLTTDLGITKVRDQFIARAKELKEYLKTLPDKTSEEYKKAASEKMWIEGKVTSLDKTLETDHPHYGNEANEIFNYWANGSSLQGDKVITHIDSTDLLFSGRDLAKLVDANNRMLFHYQHLVGKAGRSEYINGVIDQQQKMGGIAKMLIDQSLKGMDTHVPDPDITEVDKFGNPITPEQAKATEARQATEPVKGQSAHDVADKLSKIESKYEVKGMGKEEKRFIKNNLGLDPETATSEQIKEGVEKWKEEPNEVEAKAAEKRAAEEQQAPKSADPNVRAAENNSKAASDKSLDEPQDFETGYEPANPIDPTPKKPTVVEKVVTGIKTAFSKFPFHGMISRIYNDRLPAEVKENQRIAVLTMRPKEMLDKTTFKVKEATEGLKAGEYKHMGNGIYFQGYAHDVQMVVDGKVIGLVQPPHRLAFKRGIEFHPLSDMTREEYARLTGNKPESYEDFMRHMKGYKEFYDYFMSEFKKGKTEFSKEDVAGKFDIVTWVGGLNYSYAENTNTPVTSLKYRTAGDAVVSMPLIYDKNIMGYTRSKPLILNGKELSAEDKAKLEKFLESGDAKRKLDSLNRRYAYIFQMPDGSYQIHGIAAARPLKAAADTMQKVLDILHTPVAGKDNAKGTARVLTEQLNNLIYIADSNRNPSEMRFQIEHDGTVAFHVYNEGRKIGKAIRLEDLSAVNTPAELVGYINRRLSEKAARDKDVAALNLSLHEQDFKQYLPNDDVVTKADIEQNLAVTVAPEVFLNPSVAIHPIMDPSSTAGGERPEGKPRSVKVKASIRLNQKEQGLINTLKANLSRISDTDFRAQVEKLMEDPTNYKALIESVIIPKFLEGPSVGKRLFGNEVTEQILNIVGGKLPSDRRSLQTGLQTIFGLPQEQALAVSLIYDRVAKTWAERNGRDKADFYDNLVLMKGHLDKLQGFSLNQDNFPTDDLSVEEQRVIKKLRNITERDIAEAVKKELGAQYTDARLELIKDKLHKVARERYEDFAEINLDADGEFDFNAFSIWKNDILREITGWNDKEMGLFNHWLDATAEGGTDGHYFFFGIDTTNPTTKALMDRLGITEKELNSLTDSGLEIRERQSDIASGVFDNPDEVMADSFLLSNRPANKKLVRASNKREGVLNQKARAAVHIAKDGTATIYALTDPNVSSPLHELAHIYESSLTGNEISTVLEWAGHDKWSVETSEKFARGFEKYLSEGNTDNKSLKLVFENFKRWLLDIYKGIVGSDIDVELNDKMREIYKQMLGETGVESLKKEAKAETKALKEKEAKQPAPELAPKTAPVKKEAKPVKKETTEVKKPFIPSGDVQVYNADPENNLEFTVAKDGELLDTIEKFNGKWFNSAGEEVGTTREEAVNNVIAKASKPEEAPAPVEEVAPAPEEVAPAPKRRRIVGKKAEKINIEEEVAKQPEEPITTQETETPLPRNLYGTLTSGKLGELNKFIDRWNNGERWPQAEGRAKMALSEYKDLADTHPEVFKALTDIVNDFENKKVAEKAAEEKPETAIGENSNPVEERPEVDTEVPSEPEVKKELTTVEDYDAALRKIDSRANKVQEEIDAVKESGPATVMGVKRVESKEEKGMVDLQYRGSSIGKIKYDRAKHFAWIDVATGEVLSREKEDAIQHFVDKFNQENPGHTQKSVASKLKALNEQKRQITEEYYTLNEKKKELERKREEENSVEEITPEEAVAEFFQEDAVEIPVMDEDTPVVYQQFKVGDKVVYDGQVVTIQNRSATGSSYTVGKGREAKVVGEDKLKPYIEDELLRLQEEDKGAGFKEYDLDALSQAAGEVDPHTEAYKEVPTFIEGEKVLYGDKQATVVANKVGTRWHTMEVTDPKTGVSKQVRVTNEEVKLVEIKYDVEEGDKIVTKTEEVQSGTLKKWVNETPDQSEVTFIGLKRVLENLRKRFNVDYTIINEPDQLWAGRFKDGKAIINIAHVDRSTPFHEYLHPFIEIYKKENALGYQKLVGEYEKLLKEGDETAMTVRNDVKRFGVAEEHQTDEALVRYISQLAAANVDKWGERTSRGFIRAIVDFIGNLRDWLRSAWQGISLQKYKEITAEGSKWVPLQLSLQDIADFVSLTDFKFDMDVHKDLIKELDQFQMTSEFELGTIERLKDRLKTLEDTARRRLPSEELRSMANDIRRILQNENTVESLQQFMVNGVEALSWANKRFYHISETLRDKKGNLSVEEVTQLNKDLQVVKATMAFYLDDVNAVMKRIADPESMSDKAYRQLQKTIAASEDIAKNIQYKMVDGITEWLWPYVQNTNERIKHKYPDYVLSYDQFRKNVQAANGDIDRLFYFFGAVASSKDALSGVVRAALYDVYESNHYQDAIVGEKIKNAYADFLKEKGLQNDRKLTSEYYKQNWLRKATVLKETGEINDKGDAITEYRDRWAFHQPYFYDLWAKEYDAFINSLGEAPLHSDEVAYKAYSDKIMEWLMTNGSLDKPHERFRNPEFDKLYKDPLFKEVYDAYMEGNGLLDAEERLKFGEIPQVSAGKEMFVDMKWGKDAVKNAARRIGNLIAPEVDRPGLSSHTYNLDESVHRRMKVPYVRDLEEVDIDFALPETVYKFSSTSRLVGKMREAEPNIMTLRQWLDGHSKYVPQGRKVMQTAKDMRKGAKDGDMIYGASKEKTKQLVHKQLNAFIDDVVYGVTEIPDSAKVFGRDIDLNKLGGNMAFLTALNNMAGNVTAGISNVVIGNIQTLGEAAGGKYYSKSDWAWANKEYYGHVNDFVADSVRLKKSKITQLGILFDAIQGEYRDKFGKRFVGSVAQRFATSDTFFVLTHAGEHEIQIKGMLALLKGTKVKTTGGEEISLYDAYQLDKNGHLRLREDAVWSKQDTANFTNRLHAINKNLNGNYSTFDKAYLQRKWYGRLALVYRKYLYNSFRARYGEKRIDHEFGDVQEGYYRTFMNKLWSDINNYKFEAASRFFTREGWNEEQRYAYNKTLYELSLFIGLTLVGTALGAAGDDKKPKNWGQNYLTLMMLRARADVGMYSVFGWQDMYRTITTPSAVIMNLKKYGDVLVQLLSDPMAHYTRKTGAFDKGDSVMKAKIIKALPIMRQFINLQTPDEQAKLYNLLNKNF